MTLSKGIQVVITSRTEIAAYFNLSGYRVGSLKPLVVETIRKQFTGDEWNDIKDSAALYKLLSNPMMVTIYKEICPVITRYRKIGFLDWALPIENVSDLLHDYFVAQIAVLLLRSGRNGPHVISAAQIVFELLPAIAYEFESRNTLNATNEMFRKPTDKLKDVRWLVEENIRPYNNAYCNFILNVAPNRAGLMDDNAVEALRQIGQIWQNEGPTQPIPECDAPITLCNIAKGCPTEYSWSYDYGIGDFANDDNFSSAWESHPTVDEPWWEVDLRGKKTISLVTIVEGTKGCLQTYRLECKQGKQWYTLFEGTAPECRVKQHRFAPIKAEKVRITVTRHQGKVALSEVGVY